MPLSAPAPRRPVHERRIACWGYEREDGLFDIEGHLHDSKGYTFENEWRGTLTPGMPVHDMWLRMTIDADLVIQAVEITSDATPYPACPAILPNYEKLVGLRIGAGFTRDARAHIGRVLGCTHQTELLGRMATVAMHTVLPLRKGNGYEIMEKKLPSSLLDSCHTLSRSSETVKQRWPDSYEPGTHGDSDQEETMAECPGR